MQLTVCAGKIPSREGCYLWLPRLVVWPAGPKHGPVFSPFLLSFPTNRSQSHNWKPHESATRGNLMGFHDGQLWLAWPAGNAPKSSARGSVFGLCGGAFNVFSICVKRTFEGLFFMAKPRKKPKYHVILRLNEIILAVEDTYWNTLVYNKKAMAI